ncbi:MAG: diguanylate cyclase [Kangiella sp.]|nr:MAG: diguanylate cyclase [Kangiella sp.]
MTQNNSKKQLLLINTNAERLAVLKSLLLSHVDYHVITASTAQEAVESLKTNQISFVVSNIHMGTFDGWRLARLVRSGVLKCSAEIPFVIVANTWCEHIANTTAKEFGVNQLISYEDRSNLVDIVKDQQSVSFAELEKISLLVIEDNLDTQHLVGRILGNQFDITAATDGEMGLALWKRNTYSLVLLDVMLPIISGNEILKKIIAENPAQSVVIMTANHSAELTEELMLAGAADFITKPFRAEQLRRVCSTASRREDYIISTSQFAAKVESLNKSRLEYKTILDAHQLLLDQLGSVVIELNGQGQICFLNKAWEKLTGFTIKESLNCSLYDFIQKAVDSPFQLSSDLQTILSGKSSHHTFEFKIKNKHGEDIWAEAKFEKSSGKDKVSLSGTIDNITSRKKAQQDLEHAAMHDALTGLFNRHFFETELDQFTATAARGNGPHTLLYIDLDHFKIINDTVGHHHGDVVLKNIASLIKTGLRHSDVLCRIGGDEFALLLPNTDRDLALMIAGNICQSLVNYRCLVGDQVFKVSCSIGISEINGESSIPKEHMKQADIALYAAKKEGRNIAHVYDINDEKSKDFQASMEWAKQLQQAVVNDKLVLYFQPIIEIKTGKIVYYEALVRLLADNRVIPPNEFIPALEREGIMHTLDEQVINKAISYLSDYPKLTKIAINLSAQGFSNKRLVPYIIERLEHYRVDASRIIFELTESASLSNITETQKIVANISELGCAFSIDDFGTGFSTFNYLKQLPAESVKIDGSFVLDLANSSVDRALVKAIYEVAKALNKKTVAEFVENQETLDILAEIGVTYAQGYHISKPMPIDELFA